MDLVKRVESAKNGDFNAATMRDFLKIYDLFLEFLALFEGIGFTSVMRDGCRVVRKTRINGMTFVEEVYLSDFLRDSVDSRKFVDWALGNGLRKDLVSALRPFGRHKNPK